MKLLRDLFMNVGGTNWELGRFLSAYAIFSFSFAFLWALIVLQKVPDWSSLGVGYGSVLLGAGAYIGIKDFARAKSLPAETEAAEAAK